MRLLFQFHTVIGDVGNIYSSMSHFIKNAPCSDEGRKEFERKICNNKTILIMNLFHMNGFIGCINSAEVNFKVINTAWGTYEGKLYLYLFGF